MARELNEILRLGFLVHDVSRVRRGVADRALKPLNITRAQWWLLAYLSRSDGMTQTSLARELDLSKVSVGEHVSRLEKAGYVERRVDPEDGRTRRVCLSREGTAIIGKIRSMIEPFERDALCGISDDDLKATDRTLRAILKNSLQWSAED